MKKLITLFPIIVFSLSNLMAQDSASKTAPQADAKAAPQVDPKAAPQAAPKKTPQEVFTAADKNSDGKVTLEEFTAVAKKPNKAAARFTKIDSNSDGTITLEEVTAAAAKKDAKKTEKSSE